jgi:hypothetical protein
MKHLAFGRIQKVRCPRRPREWFTQLACIACVMSCLCGPAHSQDNRLGRLFFTPAERQALDLRRGAPADISAPQTVTVNGIIVSPGKAPILFLDGKEVRQGEGPAGVTLAPQTNQSVRIQADGGPAVSARPGQMVDLTNGRTMDGYQTTVPVPVPTGIPLSEPLVGGPAVAATPKPGAKPPTRAAANSKAATR